MYNNNKIYGITYLSVSFLKSNGPYNYPFFIFRKINPLITLNYTIDKNNNVVIVENKNEDKENKNNLIIINNINHINEKFLYNPYKIMRSDMYNIDEINNYNIYHLQLLCFVDKDITEKYFSLNDSKIIMTNKILIPINIDIFLNINKFSKDKLNSKIYNNNRLFFENISKF